MAVDSSWDIKEYHNKFDPKEHWELKKEFILAHKKNIPEDKLVSLAQVYVNMELLGCRYPASISNQVRDLSMGLGANYRDSRQNKLQRTFVKASDAVLAKLRKEDPATSRQRNSAVLNSEGTNSKDMMKSESSSVSKLTSSIDSVLIQQFSTLSSETPKNAEVVHGLETYKVPSSLCSKLSDQQALTCGPSEVTDQINTTNGAFRLPENNLDDINITCDPSGRSNLINNCGSSRPADKINTTGKTLEQADPVYTCAPSTRADSIKPISKALIKAELFQADLIQADLINAINSVWKGKDPLGKLILINRTYCKNVMAKFILNHSLEASGSSYSVDFNPRQQTYIAYVNKTPVESVPSSIGLEAATEQLALIVLDNLCQRCCMLEIKKEPVINSQLIQMDETGGSLLSCPAITNDNIGYKMLKMMGWSEGGLGKDGTGRTDPIEAGMMWGRKGLGYTDLSGGLVTPEFKEKTTTLIKNFIRDMELRFYESEEFLFSSNLSEKQLSFIHSTARQFMLKSNSYLESSGCYIVVTLELTVHQKLLKASKQGSNNVNFAVHLPGTYSINIFNLTLQEVDSINNLRSSKIEWSQSAANHSASEGKMIGRLITRKAGQVYANNGPSRLVDAIDNTSGPSTHAENTRKPPQVSNSIVENYSDQKQVHVPFSTPTCEQSCHQSGMNQPSLNPQLSNKTTMDLSNSQKLNAIRNIWGSNDPLSKLILINLTYSQYLTPHCILLHSFRSSGMTYTVSSNTQDQTYVAYVNKVPFQWVPLFLRKETAKKQLALAILENLCHRCCLLVVKKKHGKFSRQFQTDEIAGSRGCSANLDVSQSITDDNIGSKMPKMMMDGAEGGLAKDGAGIVQPIEPSMICGWEELCSTDSSEDGVITPEFKEKTKMLIMKFIKDVEDGVSETGELHFSPRFSKKQREFIHMTSRQLKLNSRSYGAGSQRFLVLGLSLTVHQEVLQHLRRGTCKDKFEVHLPGTYNLGIFNFVC